jgi:hypothetical protein
MPTSLLTGTFQYPDGRPATGATVEARRDSFPQTNRIINTPITARCNQQGNFSMLLEQSTTFRLIIRDLGLDLNITIPATATVTLDSLTP